MPCTKHAAADNACDRYRPVVGGFVCCSCDPLLDLPAFSPLAAPWYLVSDIAREVIVHCTTDEPALFFRPFMERATSIKECVS